MKNIKLNFSKPYNRDEVNGATVQMSLEVQFDMEIEALVFQRELNALLISYMDPNKDKLET